MDMLRKFFEIEVDKNGNPLPPEVRENYKLFVGGEVDLGLASGKKRLLKKLQIAEYSNIILDYQGQYPVILINFKDVKGSSYKEIEDGIENQVIRLFSNHRYLKQYIQKETNLLDESQKNKLNRYFVGDVSKEDIKDSVRFLSELLYKHFNQKVYILIDEYDTPINTAYIKFADKRSEEFEQVMELFRGIFGNSLKTNPYLEKGVITGILRVAKANLFSDLNNLREYSLLDQNFVKFYGFTQSEVDELLTKVPVNADPEQIKNWYNGYNFAGKTIYNPWSIMQCLADQGKLGYYWLDSGGTGLVDKILESYELQESIQSLAAGKTITSAITKHISFADIHMPVGLFSLLLFSGYLNPTTKISEEDIYELAAPNHEVRHIYKARMLKWVTDQINIDNYRYYSFIMLLADGKIDKFKEGLQELLLNSSSFHQVGEKRAELFYSGFMFGIVNMLGSNYIITNEIESGSGRPDIMMIPKNGKGDKALIVEYKIAKIKEDLVSVAEKGLRQIIDKQYDTTIDLLRN